jgi:NADPH:quinone reductase-like Zn-dependent oxidoreductase
MATMRTVVIDAFGGRDRLKMREVERPAPGPGQLLVRVRAVALNPADGNIRRGEVPFFVRPRLPATLGFDIAGDVEAVGSGVTRFQPGNAVFGLLELTRGGGYAEFALLSEATAAPKPAALNYPEAASIPVCGLTALQALRDVGRLKNGDAVLIHGAAGGVGTFAVQIAVALGAAVTATCGPSSAALVRRLGASSIIDYTQEDFTRQQHASYDVVFDAVAKRSFSACVPVLRPRGTYVVTVPSPSLFLAMALRAPAGLFGVGRRPRFIMAKGKAADLETLGRLVEEEKLHPVVDRTYPLADVQAATDYLEAGHAHGKVVLEIA